MKKKLAGVYEAVKKDGTRYFRSSITYQNKHISLGSFITMEQANSAYLEAGKILGDNYYTILRYHKNCAISFEKWVVLINFRDNGIYISNPIYVRPKFFYYYLDYHTKLTFDIDDLFYYSSHKIMRRNGHYFVADYGMQVNIQNKYGIKNYGVIDRDYRFINQNPYDFRYEDIMIINHYNGVTKIEKNGKASFQVKIHVKGNYLVGTYKTKEEAAIAYNKAIDLLKKAGVQKAYVPNYLEGLSPAVYADIYSKCKVSEKLSNTKLPGAANR